MHITPEHFSCELLGDTNLSFSALFTMISPNVLGCHLAGKDQAWRNNHCKFPDQTAHVWAYVGVKESAGPVTGHYTAFRDTYCYANQVFPAPFLLSEGTSASPEEEPAKQAVSIWDGSPHLSCKCNSP